ncbi:protein FAM3C-like [Eucyclogobius newberryi]|uniref:protein FAM3C-like n=1 Tax=Eucyclogobius newberryi TaxID=166745 RepID=UPI003B5C4363
MTEKRAVPETSQQKKKSENPCPTMICAEDHFSFFIQSGAANLVPPTICFRNQLVLGKAKENSGVGINAAIFNGKTGELIMTGNYDMYAGEVGPLIETLKKTETGSLVLIASFDEPASKLNGEARTLLLDLGSSSAQSLAFRDNWVFVGGKGAAVKSPFEKHIKNDQEKNKYDGWPEVLDLSGCIPQYLG